MQDTDDEIRNVHLSIHKNNPEGPDGWSVPAEPVWARAFGPAEFTLRPYGEGQQGWYDPPFDEHTPPPGYDHRNYSQINIANIAEPFTQQEGEI